MSQSIELPEYFDPRKPYFYVAIGETTKRVLIREVKKYSILIDAHPEIQILQQVQGYFSIKDDRGIMEITAKVSQGQKLDESKFDVILLDVVPGSAHSTNRRDFMRLPLIGHHEAVVVDDTGKEIKGRVLDLSAGGSLIKLPEPIDRDKFYLMKTGLPFDKNNQIETAFMVVYDFSQVPFLSEKERQDKYRYGVHFISDQKLTKFPVINEKQQNNLIMALNRVMIERRKTAKDEE